MDWIRINSFSLLQCIVPQGDCILSQYYWEMFTFPLLLVIDKLWIVVIYESSWFTSGGSEKRGRWLLKIIVIRYEIGVFLDRRPFHSWQILCNSFGRISLGNRFPFVFGFASTFSIDLIRFSFFTSIVVTEPFHFAHHRITLCVQNITSNAKWAKEIEYRIFSYQIQ